MGKTYILTESELQAKYDELKRSVFAEVRQTAKEISCNDDLHPAIAHAILNAPTPDLSHLKEAEQK
jgi:hypothetical protein